MNHKILIAHPYPITKDEEGNAVEWGVLIDKAENIKELDGDEIGKIEVGQDLLVISKGSGKKWDAVIAEIVFDGATKKGAQIAICRTEEKKEDTETKDTNEASSQITETSDPQTLELLRRLAVDTNKKVKEVLGLVKEKLVLEEPPEFASETLPVEEKDPYLIDDDDLPF